jgi:hypothetical protein
MSHNTVPATPATTASPPFSSVEAPLTFIRRSDSKPVLHSAALTGGGPRELFEIEQRIVPIRDVRPSADRLSLDREGFVLLRQDTAVKDFYDDDQVERIYYPEIETVLRPSYRRRPGGGLRRHASVRRRHGSQ